MANRPVGHRFALHGVVSILLWLGGCSVFNEAPSSSSQSIPPVSKAPGEVSLEVAFVRVPIADPQQSDGIWNEIDEQSVVGGNRRMLNRNGFRAGVVGRQLPPQLAELLEGASSYLGNGDTTDPAIAENEVGVVRRRMFLRAGQKGELVASRVIPTFHVLQDTGSAASGRTYEEGQGQFEIRAEATEDGRSHLILIPELHHGKFRQRYAPGEGMFRLDNARDKKQFESLKLEVMLSPGQILILGSRPEKRGSLGDRFFRDSTQENLMTKLLLVQIIDDAGDSQFDDSSSTTVHSDH